MYPYDTELLAAVSAPPAGIADVVRVMETIDGACAEADGLKWFNWLYLEVTRAVGARVDAGGFGDPAWLASLDVHFAGLYFGAVRAVLSGRGGEPECWRILMDRRQDTGLAPVQFALAGINAHINHDLAAAIVATGVAPVHGGPHYRDYTALNDTLDDLVDEAKAKLGIPDIAHVEDYIAAFSVSAAREAAWTNAEVLWTLRGLPAISQRTMAGIDGMTTVIGKGLLVSL